MTNASELLINIVMNASQRCWQARTKRYVVGWSSVRLGSRGQNDHRWI